MPWARTWSASVRRYSDRAAVSLISSFSTWYRSTLPPPSVIWWRAMIPQTAVSQAFASARFSGSVVRRPAARFVR